MKKLSLLSLIGIFSIFCSFAQVRLNEDFSAGSLPPGWSQTSPSGDVWFFGGFVDQGTSSTIILDASGNSGEYASIDFSNDPDTTALVTPRINVAGLTNPRLTFQYFSQSNSITFSPLNRLIVDYWDGTSWVNITVIDTLTTLGWTPYSFPISTYTFNTDTVQFRFAAQEGGAAVGGSGTNTFDQDLALDEVVIEETPTCLRQSVLTSSNITSASATLNWNDPNSASNYLIEYGVSGFALGAGTQVSDTSTTINIAGLMSNTVYDWYVRAICVPGADSSPWVSANFRTACSFFNAPYTNDMENEALDVPPSCWTEYETFPNGFVEVEDFTGTASPFAGSQALYIYSSSGFTAGTDTLMAISPLFNDLTAGDKQIRFQANSDLVSQLIIGTMSTNDPSGTFTPIDTTNFTVADTYEEIIVQFNAANGYNGTDQYIGLMHDLGGTFDYIRIDNFNYEVIPSCPIPNALNTSNVTSSSADLGWTETGTATTWEVEWGAGGFSLGSGTSAITTTNPYSITGLNPATAYDFYVRAICGPNDTSAWSLVNTFSSAIQGPQGFTCTTGNPSVVFSDDLESMNGWTGNIGTGSTSGSWNYDAGGTGSTGTGPLAAHSGTQYVYHETSGGARFAEFISPAIDLSGGNNFAELSFWIHAVGADVGTITIGVGNSATGPFTQVWSYTGQIQAAQSDPWQNSGVNLDAYVGQTIYLNFAHNAGPSYRGDVALDLIEVSTCTSCSQPSNLMATNIATDSTDIAWTENGTSTNWEVEWGAAGFTPGSGNAVVTTNNPYTLNGLTANTAYDVYVRSICAPGDTSGQVGPTSFSTLCPIVSSFPFIENFDSGLGCWAQSNVSGAANWTVATANQNSSITPLTGTGMAYFYSNNYNGDATYLISPTLDLSGVTAPQMSFSYSQVEWAGDQDTLGVYYRTSATGTWTYLTSYPNQAAAWTRETLTLPNASADYYIGFLGYSGYGRGITLDSLVIEPAPACLPPTALTASGFGLDSAVLGWTENNAATSWEIEWGTAGFTLGSGTLVNSVSSNPYTLNGLMASTSYDFYVRTNCGANFSPWAGPFTFSTLLGVPYTENFDAFTAGAPTNGWSRVRTGAPVWNVDAAGTPSLGTGPTVDNTTGTATGNYIFLETSGSVITNRDTLSSPAIITGAADNLLALEFYYHMYGATMGTLEVWADTNGVWNPVTSISGQQQTGQTDPWLKSTTILSGYENQNVTIHFIGYGASYQSDMAIDDVSLTPPPANNLGVVSVDAPSSGCGLSNADTVRVTIQNFGSAAQTGFSVGYSLNGTAITPETFTGTINAGGQATYSFTTVANLSAAGAYTIDAYTLLTGDVDNANDSASTEIRNVPSVSFPYAESFESGAAGWFVDGNSSFALGAPLATTINSASDGTQAWVTNLSGVYNANENGSINSPCIDLSTASNPYMTFDLWWSIEYQWDGALMEVSTDGGVSWSRLGQLGDPNNWYNDTAAAIVASGINNNGDGWTGTGTNSSGGWVTATRDMSAYIGNSSVRLRLVLASDASVQEEGIAFDNIRVFDSIPHYPIGVINGEDAVTGVADSINVECSVSGLVVGIDRRGGNGYEFALIDMSSGVQEGITVFDFSDVSGYTVAEGDSLWMSGDVDQFRGLTQFRPDSIIVLSSGNALPPPIVVTTFDETTESKYIQIDDLVVVTGSNASGSYNMTFSKGGNNLTVRVDSDSDLDDSLGLANAALNAGDTICSVIGIGGQFDSSNPFTSGYQMLPSYFADLDTSSCQSVGVSEDAIANSLEIYPNPTNGQFTISTSGLNEDNARIEVRDISGKIILEDNIAESNQAFNRTYELGEQAKGLYFISIVDGENRLNYKLIVQ